MQITPVQTSKKRSTVLEPLTSPQQRVGWEHVPAMTTTLTVTATALRATLTIAPLAANTTMTSATAARATRRARSQAPSMVCHARRARRARSRAPSIVCRARRARRARRAHSRAPSIVSPARHAHRARSRAHAAVLCTSHVRRARRGCRGASIRRAHTRTAHTTLNRNTHTAARATERSDVLHGAPCAVVNKDICLESAVAPDHSTAPSAARPLAARFPRRNARNVHTARGARVHAVRYYRTRCRYRPI